METITRQVQNEIENVLQPGRLRLEERFRLTRPDRYARRLLHRDPARRYTVLVLAWAPGQGTPIHDHPNLWSVEGVLEGELEVTQYAPIKEEAHRCRFAPVESHRVVAGEANFLIPPFEYHALSPSLPPDVRMLKVMTVSGAGASGLAPVVGAAATGAGTSGRPAATEWAAGARPAGPPATGASPTAPASIRNSAATAAITNSPFAPCGR